MANSFTMGGIPFDAKLVNDEWDRVFYSADIARYFGSLFSNGVLVKTAEGETLTDQLRVTSLNNAVQVSTGFAVVEGKLAWITADQNLDIDPNTLALPRVDNIVIEKSDQESDRANSLKVVKGVPGQGIPSLVRDDYVYQLCLAQVTLAASSSTISSVLDTRANEDLCGIAKVVVGPQSISGIDEVRLVTGEPTDAESQAEPRVMFMWGE